jgi:hypothetical protein
MPPFKLLAAASVALLGVPLAPAKESAELSAEFLKQASPLIYWPKGLEPRNVDVFVNNEGSMLGLALRDPCAPLSGSAS